MADKHFTRQNQTRSTLPKHEGYRNYPTWCTSLWIQNEEPLYRFWAARAREIYDAAIQIVECDEVHRKVIIALASELQDVFEGSTPVTTGVYTDLLSWALKYVDWCEVAEQLIEEE